MKIFLHYTIWNKAAHVPWICEGIRTCIPKDSIIDFVLDGCTDKTEENLKAMLGQPTQNYGSLGSFDVGIYHGRKYRWPNTNDAIKRFLNSDCDLFLSPQDDQMIQDKKLVNNLLNLYRQEQNIGIVGMRDGIDFEGKYHSSNFSKGTFRTYWLSSGQIKKVRYVNDGPICISKSTIQKVGLFDEDYIAHYADNDYGFRCNAAGLHNYVMGAEIVHEKWSCKVCGEVQPSEVWTQEISTHDYQVYKTKWPNT